jgi:hypothetical protein
MVFGLHWVATPLILLVLIRVLLDLRRRVALAPASGWSHPLLLDDLPAQRRGPDGGRPALAAAPARPGGGQVAGRGDRQDEDNRAQPAGQQPDPVGGERTEDRHPDPR